MIPRVSLGDWLNRLGRLPGNMEEVMANLASKPRAWWLQSLPYPLVNVREEDDAFHLEAEVPGLAQDEIEVSLRHGTELTLQGERKAGDESGTWHHQERSVGRFQRVLTLPAPVNADKVQAHLAQGVLKLLLPKTEAASPQRIPVQTANGQS